MAKKTATPFPDGIVRIYSVGNSAAPGKMPVKLLTQKLELRYYERTVGLTRFYTAMQANVNVKYVLRCPYRPEVSAQDIAVPNDGKQYRIRLVQRIEDSAPLVMDLTLEGLREVYPYADT
jgi:SPP1 family predicted phage head-tail adaptor